MKETCEREYRFGTVDIFKGIKSMKLLGWKPTGQRRVVTILEYEREVPEPPAVQKCPSPASIASEDQFGAPVKPPELLSKRDVAGVERASQSGHKDIGERFEGVQ